MSIPVWLVLAACVAASYSDVRSRRIPNLLTGSLALAAIVFHGFYGITALLTSLAVMLAVTAIGTLVYSRGGIGAGDIKLWIAASGMLSYPLCIPFLLYTMIGGGVLAIAFMVARGGARHSIARAAQIAVAGPRVVVRDKSHTLPYAVAFAFGAATVALSLNVAPFLRILA